MKLSKTAIAVISVLLTALIIGSGGLYWQQSLSKDYTSKIKEKEAIIETVNKENTTLKEEKTALQGENSGLKEKVTGLETDISGLRDTVKELTDKNAKLEDEKDALDKKVTALSSDNKKLRDQVTTLRAKITALEKQGTTLTAENKKLKDEIATLKAQNKELKEQLAAPQSDSLLIFSSQVLMAIKDKDMTELSGYVHPKKGLRFSPYAFVSLNSTTAFTQVQVKGFMKDKTKYLWGVYDGSGAKILMTFKDYYEEFIYDHDYLVSPMLGRNLRIGTGNSINNIGEAYPNAIFMEYHFTGFVEEYEGMDWESLRLVYEKYNGKWYLVCIVHDQWTV